MKPKHLILMFLSVLILFLMIFISFKFIYYDSSTEKEKEQKRFVLKNKGVLDTITSPENDMSLTLKEDGYGGMNVEWGIDILEPNILVKTSFEKTELRPYLDLDSEYDYLHSISNEDSYTGTYAYILNNNSNGKGNYYLYPDTTSDTHLAGYGTLYFPNSTRLSLTFKAKSFGESSIVPNSDGGWGESFENTGTKIRQASSKGRVLYLTDFDESSDYLHPGYYITVDTEEVISADDMYMYMITDVDYKNNTITLNSDLPRTMNVGETLYTRPWRGVAAYGTKNINTLDWTTISLNTTVTDFADYDVNNRGTGFYIMSSTNGKLLIDDLKLGYATRVRIDRETNKGDKIQGIYSGYDSEFYDSDTNDTEPPKIGSTQFTRDSNKLQLKLNDVEDIGTTYNYTLNAFDNFNNLYKKLTHSKTITSGVDGFSYVISTDENATVDETIDTTDNMIDINVSNSEAHYILIRAIDNNGNASNVYKVTYKDENPPTLDLKESNNSTHDKVIIDVTAQDNEGYVESITRPDKLEVPNTITSPTQKISYAVISNGEYIFSAKDTANNNITEKIIINSINEAPTITGYLSDYTGVIENNKNAIYSTNSGFNTINYTVNLNDYNMKHRTDGEDLILYATIKDESGNSLLEYDKKEIKKWLKQSDKITGFKDTLIIPKDWNEGQYTIIFTIADRYDFENSFEAKFYIDKTPPKVTIQSLHGNSNYSTDIKITDISDNTSNINYETVKLKYNIQESPDILLEEEFKNIGISDMLTIKNLQSSSLYTFKLYIADSVGNIAVSNEVNYLTEIKLSKAPYFVEPQTNTLYLEWETELKAKNDIMTNITRSNHLIGQIKNGKQYIDYNLDYGKEYVYTFKNHYNNLESKTVSTKDLGMVVRTGEAQLLLDLPDALHEKFGKSIIGHAVFSDYYNLKPLILYNTGGDIQINTSTIVPMNEDTALLDSSNNQKIWNNIVKVYPYNSTVTPYKILFNDTERESRIEAKVMTDGLTTEYSTYKDFEVVDVLPLIKEVNSTNNCNLFSNVYEECLIK